MARKIKLEVTAAQLEAIINITDEISAMNGAGDYDEDKERIRWVKNIDRMLNRNGYKRDYQ